MKRFFWMLPVGAIASRLYLTAPVHELGHLFAAWILGFKAIFRLRSVNISYSSISVDQVLFVTYAGVVFEVLFFLAFAIIFAKKWIRWSGLFFGAATFSYLRTARLTDIGEVNGVGIELFYILGFLLISLCFFWILYVLNDNLPSQIAKEKSAWWKIQPKKVRYVRFRDR